MLAVRYEIYAKAKKWGMAAEVANAMTRMVLKKSGQLDLLGLFHSPQERWQIFNGQRNSS